MIDGIKEPIFAHETGCARDVLVTVRPVAAGVGDATTVVFGRGVASELTPVGPLIDADDQSVESRYDQLCFVAPTVYF